jgi:hypothetical protein
MDESLVPLKALARELYRFHLDGVFIHVPDIGPGTFCIVDTTARLAALRRSPEAMLKALQHDIPLARWAPLLEPLKGALEAAGGADGGMVKLNAVKVNSEGPDVRLVVGNLGTFDTLVRTLEHEH